MLLVIDEVISADAVKRLRQALGGGVWQTGMLSAGSMASQVKQNVQLDDSSELAQGLSAQLQDSLLCHPLFVSAVLPKTMYPPKFNRYHGGGYYGPHVDSALLYTRGREVLRSDVSCTLSLSDPESYEGGELEIDTAFGTQSIKLAAGSMVIYPSSSLHQVTPVHAGERLSAFFWVQSLVRDSARREQLFELDQSIQTLAAELGNGHAELLRLTAHYHNLLRLWSEV